MIQRSNKVINLAGGIRHLTQSSSDKGVRKMLVVYTTIIGKVSDPPASAMTLLDRFTVYSLPAAVSDHN